MHSHLLTLLCVTACCRVLLLRCAAAAAAVCCCCCVLLQLLSTGALPLRERLCVLLAALDILRGQGEALTIDRRAFYNQLYNTLSLVPLAVLYEGQPGSSGSSGQPPAAAAAADGDESEQELLREAERALDAARISHLGWDSAGRPGSSSSGSSSHQPPLPTPVLLLRCLEQQLLGVKQTDMARLAAFVKRLAALMLSSSASEALGAACLLWRAVQRYPKLLCLLEWEGGAPVGGQQYQPDCEDPSESGAMAAALWELPLLTQHYHPHIAAAAKLLLTLTPGRPAAEAAAAAAAGAEVDGPAAGGRGGLAGTGVITGVITGAMGPQQVAAAYAAVSQGGFRPGPQVPPGLGGRSKGGAAAAAAGSSRAQLAARVAAAAAPLTSDLLQAVQQSSGSTTGVLAGQQGGHVPVQGQKKRRKQQQEQQQKGVQNGMPHLAEGLAAAAVDEVDMVAVQAAVGQQYRLSRQYQHNQQLRRELALTAKKVELFREHLILKHQQQQQKTHKVQQHKKGPSRRHA